MIKKILYGTLPYYLIRIIKPLSSNLKYYKYIKEHGYSRHLFEFKDQYMNRKIDIQKDAAKNLYYVLSGSKRLYFKRDLSIEKIEKLYQTLSMEQDTRSPHHYIDDIQDIKEKTFVDVGCAEGFTSIAVIEDVNHIYLFESDELWIEALHATFEPWKEKVTIVRKFVSNENTEKKQTLDDFFKNKSYNNLFLKMDIEGAERDALIGCKNIFETGLNLDFAICTYHLSDDEKVICSFLNKYDCTYKNQKGFFRHKLRSVVVRGKR
jgi:hypothetical protein